VATPRKMVLAIILPSTPFKTIAPSPFSAFEETRELS
jgi:hypothetical protein